MLKQLLPYAESGSRIKKKKILNQIVFDETKFRAITDSQLGSVS